MIYTLTLNPAVDKTVVIENFTPGGVNRIRSLREDVGGKAVNVSKCLHQMGCASTAVAFWGGDAGRKALRLLAECGIGSLPVMTAGETRTNLKIVDPARGENTDINEPGPRISETEMETLIQALDERLAPGDILILSGSAPRGVAPDAYRTLTARYRSRGVTVFLDADGENLRRGILAAPDFIKPNRAEIEQFVSRELATAEEIAEAAGAFLRGGVREILVSLGREGAILVKEGLSLKAGGLSVPVRSTVGAGDSMVAAFAYGMAAGLTDTQKLKLAIAISAASVMCAGTEAPEPESIESLYHQVEVEALNPS